MYGCVIVTEAEPSDSDNIADVCRAHGLKVRFNVTNCLSSTVMGRTSHPALRYFGKREELDCVTFDLYGKSNWHASVYGADHMEIVREVAKECAEKHGLRIWVVQMTESKQVTHEL